MLLIDGRYVRLNANHKDQGLNYVKSIPKHKKENTIISKWNVPLFRFLFERFNFNYRSFLGDFFRLKINKPKNIFGKMG